MITPSSKKIRKIHTKVDWIRFKGYVPQMKGEETKRIEVLDQALNCLSLNLTEIIKTKNSTTYKTKESIVLLAKGEVFTVELTGSWCSTENNFERSKPIFHKLNLDFKERLGNKMFVLCRIDLATDWLNATPDSLLPYDGNRQYLWWQCKNETHSPRHTLESSYFLTQKYTLVMYRKDISLKIDKLADKKIFEKKYLRKYKDTPITRLELRFEKSEVCKEFQKFLLEPNAVKDSDIVSFGYQHFAKKRTIKLNEGQKLRKNMRNAENYELIFKKNESELAKSLIFIEHDFLTKSSMRPVNQKQRMLVGLVNRAKGEELTLEELQKLVEVEYLKRNESVSGNEAEKDQQDEKDHEL